MLTDRIYKIFFRRDYRIYKIKDFSVSQRKRCSGRNDNRINRENHPRYRGFSAQLSFVARVSHLVRLGLFTTRNLPLCLRIVTLSPRFIPCVIWPSTETVVPSLTFRPSTSTVLSALITIGRNDSECGHIGVITKTSIKVESIGPPAERLYAVEPVGVEIIRPSLTQLARV